LILIKPLTDGLLSADLRGAQARFPTTCGQLFERSMIDLSSLKHRDSPCTKIMRLKHLFSPTFHQPRLLYL